MGRPDDNIAIDTTLLPTPPLPPLREFLAHVMPAHPALRVQQGQIEIAQQQVRVDTAALHPSVKLNLGFTGAQSLGRFNGNTLSNFLAFIQVDIPIFDFGKHEGSLFFVMPVVQGTNLRWFQREGVLFGERDIDPVVGGGGLQLEIKRTTETLP